MKCNLLFDYSLRGYTLENMARIILRRLKSNNFIFCCKHFDDIDEVLTKYRLDVDNIPLIIGDIRMNGWKSDLIEFELDDKINRKIIRINFYDVKSRLHNSRRKYHEMCISDYEFMNRIRDIGCGTFIISILLFEDWKFDFDIKNLDEEQMRIYDSSMKKTLFFS